MKFKLTRDFFRINWPVVPLKVAYFTFCFGASLLFPYQTLQMQDLGLSVEDISFINGLMPFVTFFAMPISGFIGDKIGYRSILIIEMLVTGAASTYYAFIPPFQEYDVVPLATLYKEDYSAGLAGAGTVLNSVQWTPDTCPDKWATLEACQNSFTALGGFQNMTGYFLQCPDETWDNDYSVNLDISDVSTFETYDGLLCFTQADLGSTANDTGVVQKCQINNYPGLQTCTVKEGNKATTFWIYFVTRMVVVWALNSIYPLYDSTGVIMADQHDSDYALMMLWAQLATTFGPFVAGYLVREADEDAVGDTDYTLTYYLNDVFMVISCVVVMFLNVQRIPTGEKTAKSVRQMFSVPSIIFLSILAVNGLLSGIHGSLYTIYLSDELGADDQLIGNSFSVSSATTLLLLPVANYIVRFIGEINLCVICNIGQCLLLTLVALIDQSPPTYVLYLSILDGFNYIMSWIATMTYAYKISPPDLVSTFTATVHVVEFIIMRGFGSLIGGIILSTSTLGIDDVFIGFSVGVASISLALLLLYWTVGRRLEARLVEDKKELLERASTRRKQEMDRQAKEAEIRAGIGGRHEEDESKDKEEKQDGSSSSSAGEEKA